MASQPLEHDLLDLIEGRLAPDRVEAVRAALSKDPVMLRRVERMLADRRGVIELSRATAQAARADRAAAESVVHEAIGRAEREALFQTGSAPARRRISPVAAAAAMVAIVGLAAAGITWRLLEQSQAERIAHTKKLERSGHARMSATGEPATDAPPVVGPLLPEQAGVPSENSGAAREVASLPRWFQSNPDPDAKKSVRAWTESVEQALADTDDAGEPATVIAARALERIKSGGPARLTIDEAAALALSHRLRLVVPASGIDWGRRRAEAVSAAVRSGAMGSVSSDSAAASLEKGELNVEVDAPLDADRAALRDALGDLRKRLGEAGDEGGWFELDDPSGDAAPALPSLRLGEILWWSNAPSAWRPGVSVRVRVEARP